MSDMKQQAAPNPPGKVEMDKARHLARLIEEIGQFIPSEKSSFEDERRSSALMSAQKALKEIRNDFAGEAVQKGYRA